MILLIHDSCVAPVGDTVADDEALAAAHVLLPHGGELHLARRVQDVQQARLQVYHGALLVRVLGIIMIVRGAKEISRKFKLGESSMITSMVGSW